MGPPLFVFFGVRGRGRRGVSPAGEVLSREGKYPKFAGPAGPDPGSHPEGKLGGDLTGAGGDLWLCLRSPPAAALRWVRLVFIIPCLEARLDSAAIAWCGGHRGPLGTAAPTGAPTGESVRAAAPEQEAPAKGFPNS